MGLGAIAFETERELGIDKREDYEDQRSARMEVMAPYLDLLDRLKKTLPPDSGDLETAEKLYRLVEITSLRKLKDAALVANWHKYRKPQIEANMKSRQS